MFYVSELIKRFEEEKDKKLYFYHFLSKQCEIAGFNK